LGNGVPVGVGVGVAVVLVVELLPPQPIRTKRIKQAQRVFSIAIVRLVPFFGTPALNAGISQLRRINLRFFGWMQARRTLERGHGLW
jgi:hypothetical protein